MKNKRQYQGYAIFCQIVFLLSLGLAGCQDTDKRPSAPYKAQVIHFQPSDNSNAGRWTIGEQLLQTLEDPDTLKGNLFEILAGRKLTIDFTVGSIVSGRISGTEDANPIRYSLKNGVIVPRDTTTLLMFSSFYAFERVFDRLEPVTGIANDALKKVIGGRYQILFEPTIDSQTSGAETRVSIKTNAAFNSESDNFILFRRSQLEDVPIAANIKVIAHEFGHALFKNSFFEQKNDTCPFNDRAGATERQKNKFFVGRLNTEYSITGLNEGFADFVSFMMTGDTNPLEGSISFKNTESRSLVGQPFYFYQLVSDASCDGKFYCIGTIFARALYKVASQYPKNSTEQLAFSRRVFSAMGTTVKYLKQEPALSLFPEPTKDISECERSSTLSLAYDGKVAGAVLAAFLTGWPAGGEKSALCASFAELFGTSGFPMEARSVCES